MRGSELFRTGMLAGWLLVGLVACVGRQQPPSPAVESAPLSAPPKVEQADRQLAAQPSPSSINSPSQPEPAPPSPCNNPEATAKPGLASDCYALRPGGGAKKSSRKTRRCEPQSLPYARCRSGIRSCNLNAENGPLTWFACEKKAGDTSLKPRDGSILILASNRRHNMPTGHVMYVESIHPLDSSTYKLVLSHTNYDRRCSKETNIEATYDRRSASMDIHSGAWKAWGQDLKVAGFILR